MNTKPSARRRREWSHLPALERDRERRNREPILVPIVCIGCGHDLAEVPPGTEAYCPTCRRWTSTFDMSTDGAAIA